jgi:hypothetical protein
MGSKTETYIDIGTTALFKEDDDAFKKELLRIFALTKRIDPAAYIKTMIFDINFFFNTKALEKHGLAIKGDLKSEEFTEDDADYYIKNKYGYYPERSKVYARDENGVVITGESQFIPQYLDLLYNKNNEVSATITETYSLVDVNEDWYYNKVVTDVEFSGKVYKYDLNNDGVYWGLDSYERNDDGSYKLYFKNDSDETREITTPIDKRIFYIIAFRIDGSYYYEEDIYGYEMVPSSDVRTTISNRTALVITVKKDGQYLGDERYKKAVLSKFGLVKDFEENIMQEDAIKDISFVLSTKHNDPDFKDIIDIVYGNEDYPISVIYESEVTIKYEWWRCMGAYGFGLCYRVCYEDACTNEYRDKDIFLIPSDMILRLKLKDKYDAISKLLKFPNVME